VDLMLLMSEREVQERLSAGLKLAYSRGLVDDTHLRPSLARILTFKERIRTIDQPSLEVVGSAEHRALAYQAAGCAITLIRDEQRLLPLRPGADTRMLVVMPEPHNLTPADTSVLVLPTLAEALRFYHPQVDEALISPRPSGDEITGLREKAAGYDLLILGTISASIQTEQGVLVRELLRLGKPTITVALRTPYDLVTYPEASTYLCTYSILEPSMKALGAVLFGETNFAGKLPVTIEGLYPLGHGLSVS
jgi:beta-N-acetylhexosaminidase